MKAQRFTSLTPATLILAGILLVAVFVTWQRPGAPGPQLDWKGGLGRGDLAAENVVVTQFLPDGGLDYRASAQQAYHDPVRQATFLYNVTLHRRLAQGPLTISARAGRVQDDSRVVELMQDVRIDMAPDYQAFTQRALYDPATGVVSTAAPVRLQRGGDWMSGVGLRLSVPQQRAELMSNVRAYYAP